MRGGNSHRVAFLRRTYAVSLFFGAVILLMAGYILFQTSIIMKEFPPTFHVAAALMLFATIATLFWYVLQLLMALRRG